MKNNLLGKGNRVPGSMFYSSIPCFSSIFRQNVGTGVNSEGVSPAQLKDGDGCFSSSEQTSYKILKHLTDEWRRKTISLHHTLTSH